MIDRAIKPLLLALLLICPWTFVSLGSECDDPLGGGSTCQNQDLADDQGPGGDECGGPIVVSGSTTSGSTLSVSLSNPSFSTEQGYVVATVVLYERQYRYAVPVSVAGKSGLTVSITFPGTITTIEVHVCGSRPGGINEGPDVVAIRHDEQEEEDGSTE